MPQLDGTGPQGKGSRTGRGMGGCAQGQGLKSKTQARFGLGRRRRGNLRASK